eukprot:m.182451 g.182451  ORF g.182451 m.182451 type:complete len:126 (-) comp18063_c0_seq5:20-397(-)
MDKKIAKRVAVSLNGTTFGGKKGSRYYDEIWCIKYLPKFKWHHLTERIAYENASREQKLIAETEQVRRETNLFIAQAEKSKQLHAMEKRHAKRKSEAVTGSDAQFTRSVRQREPLVPSKRKTERD